MEEYVPLSVRRGLMEPLGFHPGIPTHIRARVLDWVDVRLATGAGERGQTANAAVVDALIAALQWPISDRSVWERYRGVIAIMQSNDDRFLDVLDLLCRISDRVALDSLERFLSAGRSVWRVRTSGTPGLEERLDGTTQRVVSSALEVEDMAAEHLREAWELAYGRVPEPQAAWSKAVKALEVLLQPIVEPKSSKATLGTMVAALAAKPAKWEFVIANADGNKTGDRFVEALRLIGYEPGRHGTDPRRATLEQARAVVLQTVTIVEWLRAGMLKVVA